MSALPAYNFLFFALPSRPTSGRQYRFAAVLPLRGRRHLLRVCSDGVFAA